MNKVNNDTPAPEAAGDGEVQAMVRYNAEVLDSAPGVREAFAMMLAEVPDPPPDAAAQIVAQILNAETVEELDRPWRAEGMRELKGRVLIVHRIHKLPSDFRKALGVFLVCHVVMEATGDMMVVTTGSVSIVAQLVRAHTMGAFPLSVVPIESERPTADGYLPMHLQMVRETVPS